jgi:putative zinc finger/helix-turn-helix YgiT family protein
MRREEFCPSCEDYRDTDVVAREETYAVRGREITVPVQAIVCSSCGESLASDEQEQQILSDVYSKFRVQADLLTPERIEEIRKRYRLSQKSLAALLGMSQATINRYEKGGLQEQTHDTVIRACEDPRFVRELLQRRGQLLSDWQRRRVEDALAGQAESDSKALDLIGEVDWICMPREASEQTGFRRFDYKRFAGVVVSLCCQLNEVSRTSINKLLFYVDFLNFKTSTVSLTGAAYRKLAYGPAPADYGGLLDRMESEGLITCEEKEYPNGYMGFSYKKGPAADSLNVEFTAHERKVIEYVARALGTMTAKAVSEKSHGEAAWQRTGDRQLISYREAESLSLSMLG